MCSYWSLESKNVQRLCSTKRSSFSRGRRCSSRGFARWRRWRSWLRTSGDEEQPYWAIRGVQVDSRGQCFRRARGHPKPAAATLAWRWPGNFTRYTHLAWCTCLPDLLRWMVTSVTTAGASPPTQWSSSKLQAVKPDREWGRPGREGQEGDSVQGEQLGVVITEKRNRCRELIVVDGFSDVQWVLACKSWIFPSLFLLLQLTATSFYYSVRTQNTVTKIMIVVTMQ